MAGMKKRTPRKIRWEIFKAWGDEGFPAGFTYTYKRGKMKGQTISLGTWYKAESWRRMFGVRPKRKAARK
jgi:hypothetical protein